MNKKHIIMLILMCTLIFFVKYHGFGSGNVSEIMPLTLRLEDSSYLENDWYVNASGNFNARTNFASFTIAVNRIFNNYEITYLVLAYLCFIIFAFGFYKLIFVLTKNENLSLFTTLLPLLIGSYGLGNSFIIGDYFNPGYIAWTHIIWGLYFFFDKKYWNAFIIIGLASFFQAMSAYMIASVLTILLLYERNWKGSFATLGFYALFIMLNARLILSELFTKSFLSSSQLNYILADFRLSHHYFPSNPLLWISFIGFFAIFCYAFYKSEIKEWERLKVLVVIILSFVVISMFFSEVIHWGFITKLRLIRALELLCIIEFIFIGEFIWNNIKKLWAIPLLILIVVPCYIYTDVHFDNPIGRFEYEPKVAELYDWVKLNTPEDAIFLVPLELSSFRYGAERAVVVDWKMHTYKTNTIFDWYTRVYDVRTKGGLFLYYTYGVDYIVEESEGGYQIHEI